MGKFRKTALIEAVQWFKMGDHPAVDEYANQLGTVKGIGPYGWIETLEGGHIVTSGDWIATGVAGEHWPIKPHVFAASYVAAEPDEAAARIQELEAALKWYGEQARLARLSHGEGDAGRHALQADGGAKARQALGGDNG